MTVAAYVRVSTLKQNLERQLDELRDFAREEYPDDDVELTDEQSETPAITHYMTGIS